MSLASNAIVTLDRAKAFMTVTGASDDAIIEAAIGGASGRLDDYCNRYFLERTITAERLEGSRAPRIWLRAVPLKVTGTVTVAVDGVAQTVWKQESDGLPSAFDVIARPNHLYRRAGWADGSDPYNIVLTYTGGYALAAMPEPVTQACLYVVQKLYRDHKRQLAEVASINTPMGSVTLLDNDMPRQARMYLEPFIERRLL